MSVKKPEVGDVFSNPRTGRRRVVLKEITQFRWWCLLDDGGCVVNYDYQFDNMEYLGKSKASIKDLFEVE